MVFKKYCQLLFLAVLLMSVSLPVFAQDSEFGTFIIRNETGYLIINNKPTRSYSLEFKGDKLKPLKGDHPTFIIDGKLIQIVSVPQKNYWNPKTESKTEPTGDQLLEYHKIWESEYLGTALNAKLSVTSDIFEIERNRKVMFWSFPMPKELKSDYSHQLFLTTLIDKDILGLNASPNNTDQQKAYRTYLVDSMNTLKVSDKPFNVKRLRELLKDGDSAE